MLRYFRECKEGDVSGYCGVSIQMGWRVLSGFYRDNGYVGI